MPYVEYVLISGGNINKDILIDYLNNKNNYNLYSNNVVNSTNSYNSDDEISQTIITERRIMAIDKGIETLYSLDIKPDYIVGDFDSVETSIYNEFVDKHKDVKMLKFPSEKDYTDTELGIRIALEQKADIITIFGATGTRLDHTLSNIRTLNLSLQKGVFAQIIDEHNRIYLGKDSLKLSREGMYGQYVSIIPFNKSLEKVVLKGFKYELQNAIMLFDASMGISNEIISNEASITCENGIFIIIESKD